MAAFASFGIFLVALLVLMATRTPVAVALAMVTVAGTAIFVSPAALSQLASAAYALSSNFILVVVPMFILMGEVLSATGIGAALFRAAELWFRRLPGALAIATVWACAAFGSVCGSSPVTASTIGAMAVPQMLRRGYRSSLALGATAAGGTLGILIPPSISMIVYGVITDTSIGHLFMAGIVPGIMLATLMSMTIVVIVLRRPIVGPADHRAAHPRGEMDRARRRHPGPDPHRDGHRIDLLGCRDADGSRRGWAGALVIALFYAPPQHEHSVVSLQKTIRTTAMFLLLLTGGIFSSYLLTRLGIPQAVSDDDQPAVAPLGDHGDINLTLAGPRHLHDPQGRDRHPDLLDHHRPCGYDPCGSASSRRFGPKSPRSRHPSDSQCSCSSRWCQGDFNEVSNGSR